MQSNFGYINVKLQIGNNRFSACIKPSHDFIHKAYRDYKSNCKKSEVFRYLYDFNTYFKCLVCDCVE